MSRFIENPEDRFLSCRGPYVFFVSVSNLIIYGPCREKTCLRRFAKSKGAV